MGNRLRFLYTIALFWAGIAIPLRAETLLAGTFVLRHGAGLRVENEASSKNTIENHGTITIEQNGALTNHGDIYNHSAITGSGKLNNLGHIYNHQAFAPDEKHIASDYKRPGFDLPSSTPEERQEAAFFALVNQHKIEEFQVPETGYIAPEVRLEGAPPESLYNSDQIFDPGLRRVALFLEPQSQIELNCSEDKQLHASLFSIPGYENGELGAVGAVDHSVRIIKTGSGTVEILGDQGWFNGRLEVKGGKVLMADGAELFAGSLHLDPGTALEIASDAGNAAHHGTIEAAGSTVIFRQQPDGAAFICSAAISGDAESTLHIPPGQTIMSGNCSEFVGNVYIANDADLHTADPPDGQLGSLFGGALHVHHPESGANSSQPEILLRADSGLNTLQLQTGIVRLRPKQPGVDPPQFSNVCLESAAHMIVEYDNPTFANSTIRGSLTLASGETAAFHNVRLDGGALRVTGPDLSLLKFSGSMEVGSGLYLMGTGSIDCVDARETDTIRIHPGHNLNLTIDVDAACDRCDYILAPSVTSSGTSGLVVSDFLCISSPDMESHSMQLLTLTDPDASYPPIYITAQQSVCGSWGDYTMRQEGGHGRLMLRTATALTAISNHGLNLVQTNQLNNALLPINYMHATALSGMAPAYCTVLNHAQPRQICGARLWQTNSWQYCSFGPKQWTMESDRWSTTVGADTHPLCLDLGCYFRAGIFAQMAYGRLIRFGQAGFQYEHLFGGYAAWSAPYFALRFFAGRRSVRTKLWHHRYGEQRAKGCVYSIAAHYEQSINLGHHTHFVPSAMVEWSRTHTKPQYLSGAWILHEPQHRVDILPALHVRYQKGCMCAQVGVRKIEEQRPSQYINRARVVERDERKEKICSPQFEFNLSKTTRSNSTISIGFSHAMCGLNKTSVSLGISLRW